MTEETGGGASQGPITLDHEDYAAILRAASRREVWSYRRIPAQYAEGVLGDADPLAGRAPSPMSASVVDDMLLFAPRAPSFWAQHVQPHSAGLAGALSQGTETRLQDHLRDFSPAESPFRNS